MSAYYLLLFVVPHKKSEIVSRAASSRGSFGGTVLTGKSIPSGAALNFFGLGGSTEEIVLILSNPDASRNILDAVSKAFGGEKRRFGFVCVLNADTLIRTGTVQGEDSEMSNQSPFTLISVILNRGYADDAMSAARKAGAAGGTVIAARGTAKEGDAKFFGVHIVPEKEMLLTVVTSDKRTAVLSAIQNLPCLKEPGSGIAFCTQVEEFRHLGKK